VRGAPFPDETLEYQGARDLFRTVEFHAGEFELQDLNSQAVGLFCDPKPGETWWDACAGEGGKTLHLGDLMRNKGLIWASDRAPARLRTLKRRAARARLFNYRTSLWNGDSMPPTKTKFDGVLLDAPCSGIGTWHRNPHARWTTRPEDVVELAAIQQRLLARVVSSLKPGGRLVYAVCTLSKPETLGVASAVSAALPELEPLAVANPFDAGGEPAAQHWLWPQTHGGNGMFVALWRRTGSRA
jgi:16S rRNA (cytosine967-C5)-methyltransferase